MKVPFLTTAQIEKETTNLLIKYDSQFGQIIRPPIDIEGIVESLLKLDCRFDNLQSLLGQDVLGATWISDREVRIDESLDPTLDSKKEGRYRFTLAHEVGHWQLHRPLIEAELLQGNLFESVSGPSIVCRSTAKDPMEWQADAFAGYLLMPELLIHTEWLTYTGDRSACYLLDEREFRSSHWSLGESKAPIVKAAREMAEIFNVSGQAMQIRLIGLGLLQYKTNKPSLFN